MYKGATENIYASSGYEVIIKGDKISWNGGTSWTTLNLGFIWDYYGLVMSSDGKYIYIAEDLSTTVHRSSNYGVSWTTSTILEPYNKYETPILCSDDGSTVYIGGYYGTHQYKSTDYGATFSTSYLSLSEHWQLVGSSDLTKLYKLPTGSYEGQPEYSGDSGATWTSFGPSCKITNGICSSNGTCYANVYQNISGGYYRFYKFIGTSSTIVSSVNDRNYLPLPDLSKVVNVEKNYSDALLSNITLTSSEEIQPISYQRQSHAKSYILVVNVAGGLGCVCFYKKGLSLFVDN
ncbi:MAG: hypothetical protein EOL97_14720 [Spirochaetia bacterium]|nr:hypothetical protein [Spirochaetia bacterium]